MFRGCIVYDIAATPKGVLFHSGFITLPAWGRTNQNHVGVSSMVISPSPQVGEGAARQGARGWGSKFLLLYLLIFLKTFIFARKISTTHYEQRL